MQRPTSIIYAKKSAFFQGMVQCNGSVSLLKRGSINQRGTVLSIFTPSGVSNCSRVNATNILTTLQLQQFKIIHDSYTELLSEKKYEYISTNYSKYITLLNALTIIHSSDPKMILLIQIAYDTLIGAMNSTTLYSDVAYTDIKIILLTKRIEDILSNKNVLPSISETVCSTISIKKMIKLSPIYSYYIYLYGFPEYGVGFDEKRINFLNSLPEFLD